MTKEQENKYQDIGVLKEILFRTVHGSKFRLDCGHHITFGHNLGNDITIYNGRELKIIYTLNAGIKKQGGDIMSWDDFFDMDPFELAFALGMAETIADEEIEKIRIEQEFEKDDDNLFDD